MRTVWAVLRKDLMLELRTLETVPAMVLFSISTFVIFHFALNRSRVAGQLAAGLLTATLLFAFEHPFGLLAAGFSLRKLGLTPSTVWKIDSECRHVVVARISVSVLPHVLHIEVRAEFPARQLDLRITFLHHLLLRLDVGILLFGEFHQLRSRVWNRPEDQRHCLYVRALLISVQQLFQLCLHLPGFAMMHGDLLQNFRVLQLSL